MEDVSLRLQVQQERLKLAAERAGRDPADVTLIAVSKKQSAAKIRAAYDAGQRDFGENYVQELCAKAEELRDLSGIRWHFIGHLQSNKARFVTGLVDRIHTVSSVKLAEELGRRMAQKNRTVAASPIGVRARAEAGIASPPGSTLPLGVLVEVNVGGEESKSGCTPREVESVLAAIDAQPYLVARGLMTIPPVTEGSDEARPYFDQLVALRDLNGGVARLPELSIGMSHDADVAVAAGATFVRIGTAIFGPRES